MERELARIKGLACTHVGSSGNLLSALHEIVMDGPRQESDLVSRAPSDSNVDEDPAAMTEGVIHKFAPMQKLGANITAQAVVFTHAGADDKSQGREGPHGNDEARQLGSDVSDWPTPATGKAAAQSSGESSSRTEVVGSSGAPHCQMSKDLSMGTWRNKSGRSVK